MVLDHRTILLPQKIAIVLFLDLTTGTDKNLESTILPIYPIRTTVKIYICIKKICQYIRNENLFKLLPKQY